MNLFKLREKEYALERLRVLKSKYPEASELLDFYSHILEYQREVYEALEGKEPNWRKGMKWFYKLLEICREKGTIQISERAKELKQMERDRVGGMIDRFIKEKKAEDIDRFLFLAFLGPFYERMAESMDIDKENWLKTKCPVCGFRPHISYIADKEDVEGGRFLLCVLCGTDWLYNRNRCVNCGNEEDNSIDYYYNEENRAVQIQYCHKCGHYIKIVDMRLDGLAVPVVDDIATLVLDLWAKERGFTRFERNIFGL